MASTPVCSGLNQPRGFRPQNTYPGLHKAIVDQETWDAVWALRSSRAANRSSPCNTNSPSLLTGLVFDETGDRLSPSHAVKAGVRYRYYISHRLMVAPKGEAGGWRLPAKELEGQIRNALCSILGDDLKLTNLLDLDGITPTAHQAIVAGAQSVADDLKTAPSADQRNLLKGFVHRIEIHRDRLSIRIDRVKLASMLAGDQDDVRGVNGIATIDLPHQLKRRGVEAKIVVGDSQSRTPNPDESLISLIASAHRWLEQLGSGSTVSISDLAAQENMDRNEISRFLPLAFLAPDIVEAILAGTQPVNLTVEEIRRMPALPYGWQEQRAALGMAE